MSPQLQWTGLHSRGHNPQVTIRETSWNSCGRSLPVYGSEGWGFESLRARSLQRKSISRWLEHAENLRSGVRSPQVFPPTPARGQSVIRKQADTSQNARMVEGCTSTEAGLLPKPPGTVSGAAAMHLSFSLTCPSGSLQTASATPGLAEPPTMVPIDSKPTRTVRRIPLRCASEILMSRSFAGRHDLKRVVGYPKTQGARLVFALRARICPCSAIIDK